MGLDIQPSTLDFQHNVTTTTLTRPNIVHIVGETVLDAVRLVGDLTLFFLQMMWWMKWH